MNTQIVQGDAIKTRIKATKHERLDIKVNLIVGLKLLTNSTILFLTVKPQDYMTLGKPNYLLGNLNLGAKEV